MNRIDKLSDVCRFIESQSDQVLTLDMLAARAGMSKFHFARRFKAMLGITPKQYAASLRLRHFKAALKSGKDIDAAIYDAGYGSPSRVYENAARRLGMTPAQYRNAGKGVTISYATLHTSVGLLMIGATDHGLCFVQFGKSGSRLLERLRTEYQNAAIKPMRKPRHPQFAPWVAAIKQHLQGERPRLALPLDIHGTAFQMRVWQYLQSIPYGEVRTYGQVAAGLGQARAARAVANACARNPLAIVVPCHRVIRESGDIGGYRWGLGCKRALLSQERARAAAKKLL